MDHPIIMIAAALTEWLAARSFSQPVSVARRHVVQFELKDLKTVQVSVVPADWDSQVLTRVGDKLGFQIDVAVQQKVNVNDVATIDALIGLVWEIELAIKRLRLATTPPAQWTKVEKVPGCEPGFAPEHLGEQFRTFTSVRRHTFVLQG
jgi:hypothetical protein